MLCVGPLRGWLFSSGLQSLPDDQKSQYLSQPDVMWVPLPDSAPLGGEPGLVFRPHVSQREPSLSCDIPMEPQLPSMGASASFFHISALPTSLSVTSPINPWL